MRFRAMAEKMSLQEIGEWALTCWSSDVYGEKQGKKLSRIMLATRGHLLINKEGGVAGAAVDADGIQMPPLELPPATKGQKVCDLQHVLTVMMGIAGFHRKTGKAPPGAAARKYRKAKR